MCPYEADVALLRTNLNIFRWWLATTHPGDVRAALTKMGDLGL